MNAERITDKWVERTLERDEVMLYIKDQILPMRADKPGANNTRNIATLCHTLYLWSIGKSGLGHFLQAVVDNNWGRICDHADEVNARYHWVYRMFLYNCAPANWKRGTQNDPKEFAVEIFVTERHVVNVVAELGYQAKKVAETALRRPPYNTMVVEHKDGVQSVHYDEDYGLRIVAGHVEERGDDVQTPDKS